MTTSIRSLFSEEHKERLLDLEARRIDLADKLSRATPNDSNNSNTHVYKLNASIRNVDKDISLLYNHYKLRPAIDSLQETLRDIYEYARANGGDLTDSQVITLTKLKNRTIPRIIEMVKDDVKFRKNEGMEHYPQGMKRHFFSIVDELLEFALGEVPTAPIEEAIPTEASPIVIKERKTRPSKLTLDQKIAIRSAYFARQVSKATLAAQYQVSEVTIWHALKDPTINDGFVFEKHFHSKSAAILESHLSDHKSIDELAFQHDVTKGYIRNVLRRHEAAANAALAQS